MLHPQVVIVNSIGGLYRQKVPRQTLFLHQRDHILPRHLYRAGTAASTSIEDLYKLMRGIPILRTPLSVTD